MTRQSQWLFEAPLVLESDRYTNLGYYSNSEWELQKDDPAGFPLGEEEWEVGKLLEQTPSRFPVSSLPDWARLYLKSVRKGSLASIDAYIPMFTTITFHPWPLWSPVLDIGSRGIQTQILVSFDSLDKQRLFIKRFLFELKRIRDNRLFQDKNFKQLHENHRRLWRDVVTSFRKFEPKDLEPLLIEALLSPTAFLKNEPFWNLGKRFAQEKLPKRLSTLIAKSEWYMQDALFASLAVELRRTAQRYQDENANFKKKVESERKARAKRP